MLAGPFRTLRRVAVAATVLAALLALTIWYVNRPPLVVRELPGEATDIHYLDRDMFPDWSFSMSAKLPEPACRLYVANVFDDLQPFDGPAVEANIGDEVRWARDWGRPGYVDPDRNSWWQPGSVDDRPTWYANNGGAWELVQCSGGRVFYESFSH